MAGWVSHRPGLKRMRLCPGSACGAVALMGLSALLAGSAPSLAQSEAPGKTSLRAGITDSASATSAGAKRGIPAVTQIDFKKAGNRTKVTLQLSAPLDANAYLLSNPGRAVIDLPEVDFRPDAANRNAALLKRGGLLISGYRVGLLEAGKSRAVFDLTGAVRISSARLETVAGVHRYVVEFEAATREAFLAAAQPAAGASPANQPAAPGKPAAAGRLPDGKPVIVLDPGHGGIDAGARGATRAWEKEVVLVFAQTLREKLEQTGRYRVILTRNEDVFVSLPDRVKIAREAGAKLFISIHADSLNERSVEGATVYTVADRASDIHAARLAEKENQADKLAGVEQGEEVGEVSDILFDLTRKETRAFSHYFARSLVGYWTQASKLNKNPLRSAGFRVLMAPDVPSVLLELGYLSSHTEAVKLSQPEWRRKAAGAVVKSIEAFFSTPGGAAPLQAQEHQPASGLSAPKAKADVASKVQ